MLLIGILLLAAAGAFTGLVVAENRSGGPDYTVTMFDTTVATVNTLGAFLAGIGMTLVFCIALALILGGSARRRRRSAAAPRHAASHGPAATPHETRTEALADDDRTGIRERATGPESDAPDSGTETRHGRLRHRLSP
ncbi:hypothetical protein [Streptomyces sp. NPDC056527]|uniref:hypothetical protein n=1 Tax=Streptomyces sp. NPDC056527 TaxID=3345853 RepID=UPI0036C3C9AF